MADVNKTPLKWSKYLKEKVVIAAWIDLCNGLTKQDIMTKLDEDMMVEGVKTSELSKSMRYKIISDAYAMAKEEMEEQRNKQRELFYSRLTAVYNEAMIAGDRQNALKALDMFAKFGALYEKEKIEIYGHLDHNIVVDFGFDDNNDTEE